MFTLILPKNELVQHIQKLLFKTNKLITFMWVPFHVGILGNEKADSIANEVTILLCLTHIVIQQHYPRHLTLSKPMLRKNGQNIRPI